MPATRGERLSGITALLLALPLGSFFGPAAASAGDVRVVGVDPPDEIRADLARLRAGIADDGVVRRLGESDVAAPYIRRELVALDGRARRDAQQLLATIREKADGRNRTRAARWGRDGRLDLFAEFVSGCTDTDAVVLVDLAAPRWNEIDEEGARLTGRPIRFGLPQRYRARPAFPHLVGERLTVDGGSLDYGLVRAGDCRFDTWERCRSTVLVRGTFTDPPKPAGSIGFWLWSVGIVNSPMSLGQCQESLIVADGDIELTAGMVSDAVIIANGSIRSQAARAQSRTVLAATGDIGPVTNGGRNVYHSGGTVQTRPGSSSVINERQKSLPFGIRFLDPAEFGLTLAAQNGGIQVMDIAPGCVFARHGVEDADVILSVDDKEVDTAADFRRALRRGVIQESVTLRIKRGDARLTRIVFLDDVPAPTAPPPRPKP